MGARKMAYPARVVKACRAMTHPTHGAHPTVAVMGRGNFSKTTSGTLTRRVGLVTVPEWYQVREGLIACSSHHDAPGKEPAAVRQSGCSDAVEMGSGIPEPRPR